MSDRDGDPPEEWSLVDSRGESLRLHLDEDLPVPVPWRDETMGPMPMRRVALGPEVPDLMAIDREAWPRVLLAVPTEKRVRTAVHPALDVDGRREAVDLALSLGPSPTDRAREALEGGPRFPSPSAERKGWRQMTLRIPAARYEDLAVVAEMLGTRPAELARMFVLSGTRRALADQDAAG